MGRVAKSRSMHRRHSALLIERDDACIMIDGGADWLHRLRRIASTAIVLTRAHADHVAPRASLRRPGGGCSVACRFLTDARCRSTGPCALAGCGFAPSRCGTPFVLLPSAIAYRPTVPPSSICLMSPNCRRATSPDRHLYRRWRDHEAFDGAQKGRQAGWTRPPLSVSSPGAHHFHPLRIADRACDARFDGCADRPAPAGARH